MAKDRVDRDDEDLVRLYLTDIGQYTLLTKDDEVRLAKAIKAGKEAIETLDAGWRHVIAPDTIIFKRRRDFSLVTESNNRKSIVRSVPAMAIDRVRQLGANHR